MVLDAKMSFDSNGLPASDIEACATRTRGAMEWRLAADLPYINWTAT